MIKASGNERLLNMVSDYQGYFTVAQPLFERFVARLESALGRPVPSGVFAADMQVHLVNDGPVTLVIDSRQPE